MTGAVDTVLRAYPEGARTRATALRGLIHAEAEAQAVGPVVEAVKWGQPSFAPKAPRIGTPIRLHWSEKRPDDLQMLVHCQTNLVEHWRGLLPGTRFDGNRAMLLPLDAKMPEDGLRLCIGAALTYHRKST